MSCLFKEPQLNSPSRLITHEVAMIIETLSRIFGQWQNSWNTVVWPGAQWTVARLRSWCEVWGQGWALAKVKTLDLEIRRKPYNWNLFMRWQPKHRRHITSHHKPDIFSSPRFTTLYEAQLHSYFQLFVIRPLLASRLHHHISDPGCLPASHCVSLPRLLTTDCSLIPGHSRPHSLPLIRQPTKHSSVARNSHFLWKLIYPQSGETRAPPTLQHKHCVRRDWDCQVHTDGANTNQNDKMIFCKHL